MSRAVLNSAMAALCFLTAALCLAVASSNFFFAFSYSSRFLSHLLRSSSPYLGVDLSTSMSPQVEPRPEQTLPLPTACICFLALALAASASSSSRLVGQALFLKVWHSPWPVDSAALSCLCPVLSWPVKAERAALMAALE